MISFFEISSYLQLDFAKLKFVREGYTYLKASDMLPADLINITSSNDMFAPQSDYLIDLDKASAKNYEGVINSVSGSNNLVILGFKLDKRGSVYTSLKKHIDKNFKEVSVTRARVAFRARCSIANNCLVCVGKSQEIF